MIRFAPLLLLLACESEAPVDPVNLLSGTYGFEVADAVWFDSGTKRRTVLAWSVEPMDASCTRPVEEPDCELLARGTDDINAVARNNATTSRWAVWIDLWHGVNEDDATREGVVLEGRATIFGCSGEDVVVGYSRSEIIQQADDLGLVFNVGVSTDQDPSEPYVAVIEGEFSARSCP